MNTTNDAAIARHNGSAPVHAPQRSFIDMAPEEWKLAEALSKSDIIPKAFQGKPANIFVAREMAHRLGLGALEVMQNLAVVHGTPTMSAKFLTALANRSGRFRGGLQFKETPDAATCYAFDRETGERLEVEVTMAQAKRAGWTKNPKYAEIPGQMLCYRAATFFVRRFCPEVALGIITTEEAHEMPRDVPAESADPLDAVLPGPAEATREPELSPVQEALLEYVGQSKTAASMYVPAATVAKLVKGFGRVGYGLEYVAEKYGPLDQMTRETYDEAVQEGTQRRQEWEAAQRKRDEEPEAAASLLYGDDAEAEEVGYD